MAFPSCRTVSNPYARALLQPATYFGAAMLVCICATLCHLLKEDKASAELAAKRNNENLITLFAHAVARSFQEADERLQLIRSAYKRNPDRLALSNWTNDAAQGNHFTFQLAVAGPDGFLRARSDGEQRDALYIGDRESFSVHVSATEDRLFISDPILLRTSHRRGLILTRRIAGDDGAFLGVVGAIIDLQQLERFYQDTKLSAGDFASLWKLDGTIIAAGANGRLRSDIIGKRFPDAGMFEQLKLAPNGTYWNKPAPIWKTATLNRPHAHNRLVSYRAVAGFPLVVSTGASEAAVFQETARNARIYWGAAIVLTLGIFVAVGLGARREWRLNATARALAKTKERFEAAITNMPHGLSMIDSDLRIIVSNERYATMYGLTAEDVRAGTPLSAILAKRLIATDPAVVEQYVRRQLALAASREPSTAVSELPDGRIFSVSHQPMADGCALAVHQDITLQKRAEAHIWQLAHHDGLTGLANRLAFQQALEFACTRQRECGARFAVHMLDLDHFKEINDTLGHLVGDALLAQVAVRLKGSVDESAVVARLGGDEFAILQALTEPGSAAAVALAERILRVLGDPFDIKGNQLLVEASVGVALAPEHGLTRDELMKRSDLALYKAKYAGRNGFSLFEVEMEHDVSSRQELTSEMRAGILRGEFELHYQPIVSSAALTIAGYEALVRWRHPTRGLLLPEHFIAVAEETGLIRPLGGWILRRACADAARFPGETTVSVNLSPIQFRKSDLVDVAREALTQSGLAAHRLELEITESILLAHNDEHLQILKRLKELGVSIALDDFGTGYSSLSYLQQFPIDRLKIDRSFVRELGERPDCMAIVSAITGLARSLDIRTTAEGIETPEQLALLRAAGCDRVQGYLLGRPLPAAALRFEDAAPALMSA